MGEEIRDGSMEIFPIKLICCPKKLEYHICPIIASVGASAHKTQTISNLTIFHDRTFLLMNAVAVPPQHTHTRVSMLHCDGHIVMCNVLAVHS